MNTDNLFTERKVMPECYILELLDFHNAIELIKKIPKEKFLTLDEVMSLTWENKQVIIHSQNRNVWYCVSRTSPISKLVSESLVGSLNLLLHSEGERLVALRCSYKEAIGEPVSA